jgi:hypothetical protein
VQNMLLPRRTSVPKRSRASQNICFCIHSNNKMKTKPEGYLFRRLQHLLPRMQRNKTQNHEEREREREFWEFSAPKFLDESDKNKTWWI